MATPVPRIGCAHFCRTTILALNRRKQEAANGAVYPHEGAVADSSKGTGSLRVEENKQVPGVDRRRTPGVPGERREVGEAAVLQELGKQRTSSLLLDQVLRPMMERID